MKRWATNQNIWLKAFTLIEMIIVLIIMGIMMMVTLYLSAEQIQKVKDKTVKESLLSEIQSRYSRNLWSSSFAGEIYDTMHIKLENNSNKIDFEYTYGDKSNREDSFIDMFEIKYIAPNYKFVWSLPTTLNEAKLEYNPYKIWCKIWDNENIVIITRVNDHKNYCFEINQKNCRIIEVSADKCKTMTHLASIE